MVGCAQRILLSPNTLISNPTTHKTGFQGQQADYVLLSLVRTRAVGHVRDVRRLVVALSRARLGLYVAARVALFESVPELAPAFRALPRGPLRLRVGELWPTARSVEQEDGGGGPGVTVVRGVEHLMDLVEKVNGLRLAATAQLPEQGQPAAEVK